MDVLVFLCLIIFIIVRAIGLGISIDFFYDTKEKKFIYFIICWSFWIIATFFPIFADFTEIESLKEFFLVLNIILAIFSTIFYNWGFFKYYTSISFRFMTIFTLISIIIPILLYIIIDYKISIQFSVFLLYIILISAYIIPPLKKKDFINYMGKSIRWYYVSIFTFILYFPISAISFLLGYRYGVYNAEDSLIIILYYIPSIISTVLLIILLVHLEYTISTREKFKLKDKYSHDLGNIIQVIQSSSDIIKIIAKFKNDEVEKLNLIEKKCKEASKLIKQIKIM